MLEQNELYVVNEQGEVIDVIASHDSYTKLSDGDKVVRRGTIQYLRETTNIKYQFIKVNPVVWGEITNKYPMFGYLVYYLGYMDNILTYSNGKKIQLKDIHKVGRVSESTAKRQLKGLLKDDIVHKVKEVGKKKTYLVVNPFICMRGKRIYSELYEEFKNSAWSDKIERLDR